MTNQPTFVDLDLAICDLILRDPKNFKDFEDYGVSHLLADTGAEVYDFIRNHYLSYQKIPTKDTIFTRLNTQWETAATEPMKYYVDEIRRRALLRTLGEGTQNLYKSVKNRDIDKATSQLRSTLSEVERLAKGKNRQDIDYCEDAAERLERYIQVSQNGNGVIGVPFPWGSLNTFTGGIEDEDLVLILASTGKGKTWIMCNIVAHALAMGKKCLFSSMEMSPRQIGMRMDALITHMAFDSIRRGLLSDFGQKEKYIEYLNRDIAQYAGRLKILSKVSSKTMVDLGIQAAEFQPDIIFVDGIYIVKGTNPNQDKHYQREQVIEDLKFISSENKVPSVCTGQFTKDVIKGRGEEKLRGGLGDAGGAYAFSQYCDTALGLFQNEEMRKQGRMLLRMLKNRHGDRGTDIPLVADFINMDFKELQTNVGIPATGTGGQTPDSKFFF